MNVERILELADVIENHKIDDVHFNMGEWSTKTDCGTVCCVAGFASLMYNKEEYDKAMRDHLSGRMHRIGQEELELTDDEAYALFTPTIIPWGMSMRSIKEVHVAKVLRHFAATGKINWKEVLSGKEI